MPPRHLDGPVRTINDVSLFTEVEDRVRCAPRAAAAKMLDLAIVGADIGPITETARAIRISFAVTISQAFRLGYDDDAILRCLHVRSKSHRMYGELKEWIEVLRALYVETDHPVGVSTSARLAWLGFHHRVSRHTPMS